MKPRSRNRFIGAVAALALIAWIANWLYSSRYPSWKETVVMSDNRKVNVTQKREYQSDYGTHQTWLTFELPESSGTVTWNEKLYPVMLEASDGKIYVVGRPRGGQQYETYGYPRYMYVAFQLYGDKFERIPFLSVPEPLRLKENVRWCFPGGEDKRIFELRKSPVWCDDMDPKWPTPQVVNLKIRIAESLSWASGYGGDRQPKTE